MPLFIVHVRVKGFKSYTVTVVQKRSTTVTKEDVAHAY